MYVRDGNTRLHSNVKLTQLNMNLISTGNLLGEHLCIQTEVELFTLRFLGKMGNSKSISILTL